jgi:O-antigen ligase
LILDRAALAALLVLPAFLMHGRGVADTLIVLIGLAFLAHCAITRDTSPLRPLWLRVGLVWWAWLVLCSLPFVGIGGWRSFGHALAALRFLVFVAALQSWLLPPARARRWLSWVLTASALYIGLSALLQAATGRDLVGWRRGPEGELTGPFQHPRAGAPLSRLLFPVLLPPVSRWLARGSTWRTASVLLAVASVGTIVLIGQRMPALLTGLGLVVTALLLPRLRGIVLTAMLAAGLLIASSSVVSPPVWHRLVEKFSTQMDHFWNSDYGLIYHRAIAMAEARPVLGWGYEGFRNGCGAAAYCNIHPHNHYLEAATDSGVPGLALFCLLILCWWRDLFRGLWRRPEPLRVGLFVAALIQEWPLASASSFYAVEIAGFFLVLLGWGLAEADRTSSTVPSAGTPST